MNTETKTPDKGKKDNSPEQIEAERLKKEECDRLEEEHRRRAYPIAHGWDFDGTQPPLVNGQFAYTGAGGVPFQMPANLTWPKWVYSATEAPRQVHSQQELDCLEGEWSTEYIKKDYPKMKFGTGDREGETIVVDNPEDEGRLEGSWTDTPPEKKEAKGPDPRNRTLQELGESIRDSRRLSLDYGQINQDLDTKADGVAMKPIDHRDQPWPQYKASETPEQRKAREAQQDELRKKKEAEDKDNGGKKR